MFYNLSESDFFSLPPDIRQEHAENRLHLPGAGSAAARLPDVSLGELHGPRCSVSAAERRTAPVTVIQIQLEALNASPAPQPVIVNVVMLLAQQPVVSSHRRVTD